MLRRMPLVRSTHPTTAAKHSTQGITPSATLQADPQRGKAPPHASARRRQEHHHKCSWQKLTHQRQATMDESKTQAPIKTSQPPADRRVQATRLRWSYDWGSQEQYR